MNWPAETLVTVLSGPQIASLIERRASANPGAWHDEESARLAAVGSVEADVAEIRLLRQLASEKPHRRKFRQIVAEATP